MKEDIKNLQEIINLSKEEIENNNENITAILDLEDLKSLENLLTRYKEIEAENKKLKEVKSNELIINNPWLFEYLNELYIFKGKVKEKIEEYKKVIEITEEQLKHEENVGVRRRHTTTIEQATAGILALEGLLREE